MPIPIISMITPAGTGIPVSDAQYIKGANQAVQSFADLYNIPSTLRTEGMTVYVIDQEYDYKLVDGIDNSNWIAQPRSNFSAIMNNVTSGVFNHYLGFCPNITIIDTNNNIVIGQIQHESVYKSVVYFNTNISATGYCS